MKSGVIPDVDIHAYSQILNMSITASIVIISRTCSPIPIEKSTEGDFHMPFGLLFFPPYLPCILFISNFIDRVHLSFGKNG